MYNSINIVAASLAALITGLVSIVPTIIVAIIIWILGTIILNVITSALKRIDLKQTRIDNQAIDLLTMVIQRVGRALLFLIVLDFLGIGKEFVGAIFNGITLTIAIALGLAFGRALEGDANYWVSYFRGILWGSSRSNRAALRSNSSRSSRK